MQYANKSDFLQQLPNTLNRMEALLNKVNSFFDVYKIKQEKYKGSFEIDPKKWPLNGKISLKDVTLRYRTDTELVLKKLTFDL